MDNILDALSEKLDCRHYGEYLAAVCIFHDDSRPSLMIHEDTYKCLSCGAFGRTEDLFRQLSSTSILFSKPKTTFQNPWTRWTKNSNIEAVIHKSAKLLKNQRSLGQYLHNRGISNPEDYGIGYMDDWYLFPITDSDNEIIGGVARANAQTNTSQAKYVIPNGQPPDYLYIPDWKLINKADQVYLVFGIVDALTLAVWGYPAISTTTGKTLNPTALDWLRKRIVIIPDQGEIPEAMQIAKGLGWRGAVKRIDYPVGTKDINDLSRQVVCKILD